MPVGAVIGAAVVGGGASLAASSKTAGAAKDTAAQNNALQAQMYEQNKATLAPFVNTGAAANAAQGDFLNGSAVGGGGGTTGPVSLRRYPSDITVNGKTVSVGSAPPSNPTSGVLWIDTSAGSPVLHSYDEGDRRWATAGDAVEQKMLLGGQTLDAALSGTNAGATVPGPTSPSLQQFQASSGMSGPIDAIRSTLGTSEADYLARTGQDKPTQQLESLYGGSLSDYTKNTGQDQSIEQIKSQLGGSFGDYLDRSGVATGENANDKLLGLNGNGYKDYLAGTGVGAYNDAIDKFLGIGADGIGDYLKSTGYDFTKTQGLQALERSNAAKGLRLSGAALKDANTYASGLAQSYGQTYLNNLGQVASQREGQGTTYSNLLGARTQRREGLNQDYLTGLGNLTGLQGRVANDYSSGVGSLAGLKGSQASNYLAQQTGLYNDAQNAFATYWNAQGDVANRGAGAASALAGVGQNYASGVSGNNNNALQAQAGANASFANNVNSTLGNALGAWAYSQKKAA